MDISSSATKRKYYSVGGAVKMKSISSRRISEVFQRFLYMDVQHLNGFDQAWRYNTQYREMSEDSHYSELSHLRQRRDGDIEFHNALKMIMALRIS